MFESWKSQEDPEGSVDLEGPGVLKAKMNQKENMFGHFNQLAKVNIYVCSSVTHVCAQ